MLVFHGRLNATAGRANCRGGACPRCAGPGCARVGNDTTVANGAEPAKGRDTIRLCPVRSGFSARRARIPHATATASEGRHPRGPSPPGPLSRTPCSVSADGSARVRERGRIRSRFGRSELPFSLPHAVCGGGPGRGAPGPRSPIGGNGSGRRPTYTPSPTQCVGEGWASHASPGEGTYGAASDVLAGSVPEGA